MARVATRIAGAVAALALASTLFAAPAQAQDVVSVSFTSHACGTDVGPEAICDYTTTSAITHLVGVGPIEITTRDELGNSVTLYGSRGPDGCPIMAFCFELGTIKNIPAGITITVTVPSEPGFVILGGGVPTVSRP